MADRYVRSGGDAGAWTGTYASVAAALSGISNADTIYVAPDHAYTANAALTWMMPANAGLRIICANSTAAAPPTGTATTASEGVGAATAAFSLVGFGYIYGININGGTNASVSASISIGSSTSPCGIVFEQCKLNLKTTSAATINVGASATTGNDEQAFVFKNTPFKFSSTGQTIQLYSGVTTMSGISLDSAGSAPTTLFKFGTPGYTMTRVECSDLSGKTWTNLVSVNTASTGQLWVDRCKMPAAFAAITGAFPSWAGSEVLITDCASGDTHGTFQHHNALGSLLTDPGIYVTAGPSALSWKIVTTSAANYATPYVAPPIPVYHSGTSAITPYVEILRDGSATAYQNDEVWAQVGAKVTASSTMATLSTGQMALLGTAANITSGAGLGSWTGESGTAWSGKLDGAGSVTPAEAGDLSVTVCVGEPSITVYVDPVIRT